MDYAGHAGHSSWAHENVLDQQLVAGLDNTSYPVVLNPAKLDYFHSGTPSVSETLILEEGGAIAALGSTGTAFATVWNAFKQDFHEAIFLEGYQTPGAAFRSAVNHDYTQMKRNLTLLGDPALSFPFPQYEVLTETVDETGIEHFEDTLKVNNPLVVAGGVYDNNGIVQSFQGDVLLKLFAPHHQRTTLGNIEDSYSYTATDSLLQQQVAEVRDGRFEATIDLPESYDFAPGNIRLSYYAYSQQEDAAGYEDRIFALAGESATPEHEQAVFKAYPTVTTGKVFIRAEAGHNRKMTVELYNMHGECLVRNRLPGSADTLYSLSLGGYASGMYFLQLTDGDYRKTIKIIRQ